MRLPELAILYLIIGSGLGLLILVRGHGLGRFLDAGILVAVWPLYGPFLLLREAPSSGSERGRALIETIDRARGTPLSSLLPDRETALRLGAQVELVRSRIEEIDVLLASPAFSESKARARSEELKTLGGHRASRAAERRVEHLRRLRGLRERFADELAEVDELLMQLQVQAEMVRIAGVLSPEGRDLVGELLGRIEGLELMLGEPAGALLDPGSEAGETSALCAPTGGPEAPLAKLGSLR